MAPHICIAVPYHPNIDTLTMCSTLYSTVHQTGFQSQREVSLRITLYKLQLPSSLLPAFTQDWHDVQTYKRSKQHLAVIVIE